MALKERQFMQTVPVYMFKGEWWDLYERWIVLVSWQKWGNKGKDETELPQCYMRDDKGNGNQIAPVGMHDEIYVREGKGIRLPQCYFLCFILSWPAYKWFSSKKGILADIFLLSFFIHFSFFTFFHFLTRIIGHILLLQS